MATFDFGGLLGSNMFGGGDMGLEEYLTPEQRSRMNQQGIMALAASLLKSSGPSAVPIGIGQALGEAYGAGQQGYQQAQTGAIANIMTKQKLDEAKRAMERRDQLAKIMSATGGELPVAGVAITPDQALAIPNMQAGPTQARADMIGQVPAAGAVRQSPNDLLFDKYMKAAQLFSSEDPAKAKAYQDLAFQIKPTEEYSTTPQYGLSAAGTPISFVLNKSGGMKLLDIQRNPEYNYQDAGGYISVRDKTTNKEIERISKTLAPQVIGSAEGGYYQVGGGGGGRAAPAAPRAPSAAPAAPAAQAPVASATTTPRVAPAVAPAAAPGLGNIPGLIPLIPGTGKPPPQPFLDKSYGIQNANDAINSFAGVIQNFTTSDAISPTQRAQIAAAHARAILQAKELFNLGVLNGGDEKILNNVLQSPIDFSGALIPIEAIQKQAKDLQTVIKGANANLAKVYNQKEIPLNKPLAEIATGISDGAKAVSKSGKPIVYRNNQWEYE